MHARSVSTIGWLSILLPGVFLFPTPPSYGQDIRVTNTSSAQGSGQFKWTLYVFADKSILNKIEYVEYTLHPTFPQAIQRKYNREQYFLFEGSGSTAFEVRVRVHFDNNSDKYLTYMLQLGSGPRRIQLDLLAAPESVSPGQKTSITVTARDGSGDPLSNADVGVGSGGGKFLLRDDEKYDPRSRLHSPYTASGKTDEMGRFTTWWVCNPCAAGYVLEIKVRKDDYLDARSEVTIKIR